MIRNNTVLKVEALEDRTTPTVTTLGALGGGHAPVLLGVTTDENGEPGSPVLLNNVVEVLERGHQRSVPEQALPGLVQAVDGSGDGVR